jgi:membrane-associated phospholipid phosphatase
MTGKAIRENGIASRLRTALSAYRTPFHYTAAAVVVVLATAEVVVARVVGFHGVGEILSSWPSVVLGIACVWYCRWRPLPRAIEAAELAVLAVILTDVLSILIQLAGRSHSPLADGRLAAIDAAVNFHTVDWVRLAAAWPRVGAVLFVSYNMMLPMIFVATLVPAMRGDISASRRFVLGIAAAAIITAIAFWRWPAVGPWTVEGYPPTRPQAAVAAYIARLRSSLPVTADMDDAGIVSFPSFHVALTVIAAFALRRVPVLRIFAWVLCGLICISTITTGWHYGIDVVGGLMVALVSIAALWWVN